MELLFSSRRLDDDLSSTVTALLREVEAWDPDQLLTQSESEISNYLIATYSVFCPELLADAIFVDEPIDIRGSTPGVGMRPVVVPMTQVTVHIPYEGESAFFTSRPNSYSSNPPRAVIKDTELQIIFQAREFDAAQLRADIDRLVADIEKNLAASRAMARVHNDALPSTAQAAITKRKEKLLRDRNTVRALGLPVRRRDGQGPTYSVKVNRSRPLVTKPANVANGYHPEPALSKDDYEEALQIIRNCGLQLERQPVTTHKLDEEERRDLLLVALNSRFEGLAGGEVFNGVGKTDILLRVENRNVFIGECKIWRGPKGLFKGLDQLLGYLVWRDTKAALVVFIEQRSATSIVQKAVSVVREHPRCIREVGMDLENGRADFVLVNETDIAREVHLALLTFVIPPAPE